MRARSSTGRRVIIRSNARKLTIVRNEIDCMSIDPQLKVLFDRWQVLRGQGLNLTAEEICRDCPELTERLSDMMRGKLTSSYGGQNHENSATVAENAALAGNSEYPFLEPPQSADELGRLSTFRILRVLGQGGMGIVFEGEDAALHRRVAVKVLRPEIDTPLLEQRFQQEARFAASLNHDHIVTIYQIGQYADRSFLVMEYLIGESLAQRLDRDGWLPALESLEITPPSSRRIGSGSRARAHSSRY